MQFLGVKKWCSKHACWKFVKSERLLVVLREHIIFHVKWFDVRKISEVFWAKLYCKTWSCLLALKLSTRKSEIKKKLCMPEIIFSKKESQIWDFWIIYILVQISIFWGTAFVIGQPWLSTFLLSSHPPPPTITTTTIKKLPTARYIGFKDFR